LYVLSEDLRLTFCRCLSSRACWNSRASASYDTGLCSYCRISCTHHHHQSISASQKLCNAGLYRIKSINEKLPNESCFTENNKTAGFNCNQNNKMVHQILNLPGTPCTMDSSSLVIGRRIGQDVYHAAVVLLRICDIELMLLE